MPFFDCSIIGNNPFLLASACTHVFDHVHPLLGNSFEISEMCIVGSCTHSLTRWAPFLNVVVMPPSHFLKFFYVRKPTSFHTLTSFCQHIRCVWTCSLDKVENCQIMSSKTLPFYSTSLFQKDPDTYNYSTFRQTSHLLVQIHFLIVKLLCRNQNHQVLQSPCQIHSFYWIMIQPPNRMFILGGLQRLHQGE